MVYNKKSVRDIDVSGKKALVRLDLNVPLDGSRILDDNRIVSAIPTVDYLIENGAAVIICSHLGRPKGKVVPELSLKPVCEYMSKLMGKPIAMAADVVGPDAGRLAASLAPGQIMMIENTRFEPGEEKNDRELSKALASFADIFVNDAFGTAHRAHSSTAGVAEFLPSVCGFLIEKEVAILGKAINDPHPPVVAVLGGAKISDKLSLIRSFLDRVQEILICGGMSYTFIKALGGRIGKSLCDDSKIPEVLEVMALAKSKGVRLHLPTDVMATEEIKAGCTVRRYDAFAIPEDLEAADLGPDSRVRYAEIIKKAGTVIWNGPAGVFEVPELSNGTRALAEACVNCGGMTIIGGGDSAEAVRQWGLDSKIDHVSTGGGAALEFLEDLELPGISCLLDK